MATLNRPHMYIDNVLSSQPELGPSIPDGGYGWVILVISVFFKGIFPAIIAGYGIILMIIRLKFEVPEMDQYMWDANFVLVALCFSAAQSIMDPLSRKLCAASTWPRLVVTAGTCLTCAGLLLIWYIVNLRRNSNNFNISLLCIISGALSGGGSSIVLCQIEILLSGYFNLKLNAINTILNIAQALGLILTPVILGHAIMKLGTMQAITWYQVIVLQGITLSVAIRKPKYTQFQKKPYNLIRGLSDEEEDIFAKSTTELQSPRTSIQNSRDKVEVVLETPSPNKNNIADPVLNKENDEDPNDTQENAQVNWEVFEDDPKENRVELANAQLKLDKSFTSDFDNDLDRIDNFEDHYNEVPKPLFNEMYINNNTSYSYETTNDLNDAVVFEPVVQPANNTTWLIRLQFFAEPTNYKTLFYFISNKFSLFIFWTLFPSYLYARISHLNLELTIPIISCVGIGNLIFSFVNICTKTKPHNIPIFFWFNCWMTTLGFILISDSKAEGPIVFGGIVVTFGTAALQTLGQSLLKAKTGSNGCRPTINILSGISLIFFIFINLSYKNCFRFAAILQFLAGSLWLSNFIYKHIKKQIR